MNTQAKKLNGKTYNSLFNHCQKQYKNIATITKAYVINKQVVAIEFITVAGVKSLPSNIIDCETVIYFE